LETERKEKGAGEKEEFKAEGQVAGKKTKERIDF
jgi:hypothetical protein